MRRIFGWIIAIATAVMLAGCVEEQATTPEPFRTYKWRDPILDTTDDCYCFLEMHGNQRVSDFGPEYVDSLVNSIQSVTGKHWVFTFSEYWLHCHPYQEPFEVLDVNGDGKTDFADFAILSQVN